MTPGPAPEISTVADDEVVVHLPATSQHPARLLRRPGLSPDTDVEVAGLAIRTLVRPPGERLATVCTVNDTHLGETACGAVGAPGGPNHIPGIEAMPGEPPYPETMSLAAAAEIAALDPDAVVAKGDLTAEGSPPQLASFEACYRPLLGDRLHTCLGNHDVVDPQSPLRGPPTQLVSVPGLTLAILDTSEPGRAGGKVSPDQLDWLDEVARTATQPVMVLGHHPPWDPASAGRPDDYFGIAPAGSEGLVDVVARRSAIVGYAAGHTHRNLVRHFAATGPLPWIEVACVKDFPGSWAEYRVFEGGVLAVHHRISYPAALAWSERCRCLIHGCYPAYAFGSL
ncbi:MAG: metallophosphoesterase family protein, partial [Acidimicrobiales bacterium]